MTAAFLEKVTNYANWDYYKLMFEFKYSAMFSFVYLLPVESVSNLFYFTQVFSHFLRGLPSLLGWKPSYINSPDLPYLYFKFPLNFHLSLSPFILKIDGSFLFSKQNYLVPISPTFHRNIAPYRKPLWGQWLVSSSLYPPESQ